VATHRIQSLHNAVFGSCETLIAHRIISPADQEPVVKWLRANIEDKALRAEVEGSLSNLPTGTGWVCSGEAQIFKRMAFARIATYDNTKTPTQDSGPARITMAPVDVGELRELIGEALTEVEGSDPIALKARIGDLERQLAAASTEAPAPGISAENAEQIADQAHADGYTAGFDRGRSETTARIVGLTTRIAAVAQGVAANMGHIERELREVTEALPETPAPPPRAYPIELRKISARAELAGALDQALGQIEQRQAPVAPAPVRRAPTGGAAKPNGGLPKGQQAILNALAWWGVGGHSSASLAQTAFVAGYSHTSSTFDTLRSRVKSAGLIEYPDQGRMRLTDKGARLAVAPARSPTMMEYHARVRGKLRGPMQKFFDALIGRKTLTLEQLADATGYSFTSSTFDTLRSRMKSLDLITYPERGKVRISDWLYP
jgi:hypothetical protein